MKAGFVVTSNVKRFLGAIPLVEDRAAKEAAFVLVEGVAGYGKTETVTWWAVQENAVYLRAKATWTAHWLLSELCNELGIIPTHRNENMFNQIQQMLLANPRSIVIDEVEHIMNNKKIFETLRDVSDSVNNNLVNPICVVMVGMSKVSNLMARYEQISSRITRVVHFRPASTDDVSRLSGELFEIQITDEVAERIRKESGGKIREIKTALSAVEKIATRNGTRSIVTEDLKREELIHDWRKR